MAPGIDPMTMIDQERIRVLNDRPMRKGGYVLYWMQASQRTEDNHALTYALLRANERRQPLMVYFGLTEHFPEGNERHYAFLIEGLREVKQSLDQRGIGMVIHHTSPEKGILHWGKEASLVVVDRGYLSIQRIWRRKAARGLTCPLIQVESDIVVPLEETSSKEEYAAATIRPKIQKKIGRFLHPLMGVDLLVDSRSLAHDALDIDDQDKVLDRLRIDHTVPRVSAYHGGMGEARKRLRLFVETRLDTFATSKNDPTLDALSQMSPYLHFGQISPLTIALAVKEAGGPGSQAYLEELIVRRELSMNFVFYNGGYDSYAGAVPQWAQKTLNVHQQDKRLFRYTREALEGADTHDPYWNATQQEMVFTGKMHGYMRMYWGKKILEWSETPEEAFQTALFLNNKYELDGRDPNGFTGVAWCFGKHDRPWANRPIFGNVRYMNERGLKRKFDADQYVAMIKKKIEGIRLSQTSTASRG